MKKITSLLQNNQLLFLIIFAVLLRLILLFADYSWDVNNHIAWAKDLWGRGFADFYVTPSSEVYATIYPNYPPISLLFFYLIYPLQSIIYQLVWWLNLTFPLFPSKLVFFVQSRAFLAAIFKIPGIFADIGLALLIYKIAQKLKPYETRFPLIVAALILLNPAIFYNSAYWGQIDVMPLFFMILSIYCLLFSKRSVISGIFFIIALLIKPTVLIFFPLYAIYLGLNYSKKKAVTTLLIMSAFFSILLLPFLEKNSLIIFSITTYINAILTKQSLPYVTNGAFNFWILITYFNGIKDTAPFLFGLSYRAWGYGALGTVYLVILYYFLKAKQKIPVFFFGAGVIALAAFLFLTKMHERYSMLPLPFLLIALIKYRKLTWVYLYLSVMSFLNLYHSWPVPRVELLLSVINYPAVVIALSASNILVFLYVLKQYIGVCKNTR